MTTRNGLDMDVRFQWQLRAHSGSLSRSTHDVQAAANRLDAVGKAAQPGASYAGWIEAAAIIDDLNVHRRWRNPQPYACVLSARVLECICQSLACEAVGGALDGLRQPHPARKAIRLDAHLDR